MIVFNGFIFEDRKLAAMLATFYGQSKGNYIIAIAPNGSLSTNTVLYKVTITGFGTFKNVYRKTRMGRNPKTGEKIKIKGKSVVTFKPSKNLP